MGFTTLRIQAEDYDRTNFIENTPAVREGTPTGLCAAGAANLIDLVNVTDENGVCAIGYTLLNEYVQYRFNAPAGIYDITLRTSSDLNTNVGLKVDLNGATVQTVPAVAMGWTVYGNSIIKGVSLSDGAHVLGVTFMGGANINYIEIAKSTDVVVPTTDPVALYKEKMCAGCHPLTPSGVGFGQARLTETYVRNTSVAQIAETISATMPKYDFYGPENCVGECAQILAEYIKSWVADVVPVTDALISANFDADTLNAIPAGWQTFVGYVPNPGNAATQVYVDNTRAHSGTRSLRVRGPANGPAQLVKKLPSKPVNLYLRAWIYMSKSMGNDAGDNHEHVMGIKTDENGSFSANSEFRIGQGKGHLGYNIVPSDAISPGPNNWYSGPTTPINTWYCLETGILTGGAYDEAHMWVNGQLVNAVTSAAGWHSPVGANWADSVMGHVFFGWHSFSGDAAEMWIDDIVVSDKRVGCGT
jgi:hypothetical protein